MNHKQPLPGTRSCAPEQRVALIFVIDTIGYHGRSVGSIDLLGRDRVFRSSSSTRGLSAVRRSCFGNNLPDYAWCFQWLCYCRTRARANLFRNAKMEDVPMADTQDAAPQASAEFASLWSRSGEPAHRWDKHMIIRAVFKLFQRKAVL